MDFEETVRFLEGSALFAGITSEQLRVVAASATIENHPAGSVVIEEDAASDYFYLIVEGKVDIYREEKHLILETLSRGAVFGLLSIIEHKPRSATVETREPSILIKFDLNHIAESLPEGKDIYNAVVINHINDLATIIRSTNTLAIQSMKTGIEECKKRISIGNFFSSAILIVATYSFFARLAQDYIETLTTTTFVTLALLAISAVIVVSMMHYAPYSWTDYGFTLKNWRSALADTLLKTGIFIVGLTIIKWVITLAGLAPGRCFPFHSFVAIPFSLP